MPLLDHFRPPLSQRRHWDSIHGAWAEAMAIHLNQSLLPEHFVAEAPDIFEVQVLNEEGGPRLVAAVELVSPANKDRPDTRRAFAIKCASYLQSGVSVVVVDVVTERSGNLLAELLQLLHLPLATPGQGARDLYAGAARAVPAAEGLTLEVWAELLNVGGVLPTLPLWIMPDLSLPLDLEASYQAACAARRILP